MSGWTLFFIVLGVGEVTAQVFRILDAIEAPPRKRRNRVAG